MKTAYPQFLAAALVGAAAGQPFILRKKTTHEDVHDFRIEHRVHLRLGKQAVDRAAERQHQPTREACRQTGAVLARRPLLRRETQ